MRQSYQTISRCKGINPEKYGSAENGHSGTSRTGG
jgi:hypothetical protein